MARKTLRGDIYICCTKNKAWFNVQQLFQKLGTSEIFTGWTTVLKYMQLPKASASSTKKNQKQKKNPTTKKLLEFELSVLTLRSSLWHPVALQAGNKPQRLHLHVTKAHCEFRNRKNRCEATISLDKHMGHMLWDCMEHHLWGWKAQVSEASLNVTNLAQTSK